MKTINNLFLTSIFALFTTFAIAQISGSAHDFSAAGYGSTEICIFCHTPHDALVDEPLWNHAATLNTSWTAYDSPTIQANSGSIGDPTGVSLLCLSCHDGTVNIDAYGVNGTAQAGSTNITSISSGMYQVGASGDLSAEHPIGFTYDNALAISDGELFNPATTSTGTTTNQSIESEWLVGGVMHCSSCHDVHNGGDGPDALLHKANTASALCLTCHNK